MRLRFASLAFGLAVACGAGAPAPDLPPADQPAAADAGSVATAAAADGGPVAQAPPPDASPPPPSLSAENTPAARIAPTKDAPPACAGLLPRSLPAAVWESTALSTAGEGQMGCGLPIGDGRGVVALEMLLTSRPSWSVYSPQGTPAGGIALWTGEPLPQPAGFIANSGSSTEDMEAVVLLDPPRGTYTYSPRVVGDEAAFAADPRGGLLAVGRLVPGGPDPTSSTPHSVMMFGADASIRWGPVPFGPEQVRGLGVDLTGRALVLFDGSARFGPGTIAGLWFEPDGTTPSEPFLVAADGGFLQLSLLIGGGFALSSLRGAGDETLQSSWVALVPPGDPRVAPVPAWLLSRPSRRLAIARGGAGYVLLPYGEHLESCTQRVEVLTAEGHLCGAVELPLDGKACVSRELRLGLDGTLMQMLPRTREPSLNPSGGVRACTLRFWPAAL